MTRFTLLAILAVILCSCTHERDYTAVEGVIWNTTYHITYNGPETLGDSILPTLNRVGGSVSCFDSRSIVSAINRNEEVTVDSIFSRVYTTAVDINRKTGGAFDPTVAPLVAAWGFGKDKSPTADTLRIPEILQYVGIEKTTLKDGRLIKTDPRTEFNFSAIAKGYGCDAVAEMFRRNGVTDFMIEIGGEIRVSGRSPRSTLWKIAIDAPTESADKVLHDAALTIAVTDCGMATSGNYRNFHKQNGRTFGHTISPATGRPIMTDVLSATVIAPTAMEADAFATALMVLGSDEGMKMAERLKLAVYLIVSDNSTVMSTEFAKLVENEKK